MKKFNIPVYLINLASDHERRKSSVRQLHESGINPHVISAYNGHQENFPFYKYRHLSRGKWWDKDVFKPGAFACYLSHAKCWRKILSENNPYGMILEDDIVINDKSFKEFNIDNTIESFDVLFVNFGASRLLELASFKESTPGKNFVSLNKLLIDLLVNNKFNDNITPGGYGYIVSKKGAAKLLQIMEREKICMGVDYAMIFNTLNDENIKTIKNLKTIPPYLQNYIDNINNKAFYANNNRITLNSYVCTAKPLVSHRDDGASSLKHQIVTDFSAFNYNYWRQAKASIKNRLNLQRFRKNTN